MRARREWRGERERRSARKRTERGERDRGVSLWGGGGGMDGERTCVSALSGGRGSVFVFFFLGAWDEFDEVVIIGRLWVVGL